MFETKDYGKPEKAARFRPHQFETKYSSIPTVFFTEQVMDDMYVLVDESPDEISWLGLVKRIGDDFLVDEIFLVEQSCNSGTTVMSTDGQAKLFEEMSKRKGGDKLVERICFWGHSHHVMGTSPSGQDDDQMEFFSDCEYFIRAICNKEGRIELTLFFNNGVTIEDVPWTIWTEGKERRLKWKAEIKAKVKALAYVYNPSGWHGSGWQGGSGSAFDEGEGEHELPGNGIWSPDKGKS